MPTNRPVSPGNSSAPSYPKANLPPKAQEKKSSGKTAAIIVGCVAAIAAIVLIICLVLVLNPNFLSLNENSSPSASDTDEWEANTSDTDEWKTSASDTDERETSTSDTDEWEANAPKPVEDSQPPAVDISSPEVADQKVDLVANGTVHLTGTVKIATDGNFFLDWGKPQSILLTQADGTNVVLDDISSAYLLNNGISNTLWNILPSNQEIRFGGILRMENSRLYLDATEMTDVNGNELIVEQEPEPLEDKQILPQSAAQKLTSSDVDGLSLREINYAKNEIYARHGRKFKSKELQDYFNAKSWYVGTVSPENFSESALSEIERYNADYLADIEFSRSPNGYQLDAN